LLSVVTVPLSKERANDFNKVETVNKPFVCQSEHHIVPTRVTVTQTQNT